MPSGPPPGLSDYFFFFEFLLDLTNYVPYNKDKLLITGWHAVSRIKIYGLMRPYGLRCVPNSYTAGNYFMHHNHAYEFQNRGGASVPDGQQKTNQLKSRNRKG